jgi:4-amino-4-deoxy-L-arabinose transferase-like glycosyltransferase
MSSRNVIASGLIVTAVAFSLARFLALETSPPGFYEDEALDAVQVLCMAESGANYNGTSWPLFSSLRVHNDFTTPTWLYTGAAWSEWFGSSIQSMRALAAFWNVAAILGLYLLAARLGSPRIGLFVAVAASVSPWAFQFSRIAWDPAMVPFWLVWALVFWLSMSGRVSAVAGGICLAFAMYTYPPVRVQAPLIVLALIWKRRAIPALTWSRIFIFGTAFAVVSLPLVYLTVSGEIQGRFQLLSIFGGHPDNPTQGWSPPYIALHFVFNLLKHFDPRYLFVSGDANLRHSTQWFGILSWADSLAILLVTWRIVAKTPASGRPGLRVRDWGMPTSLLLVGSVGYLAGIVPAALTWESLPHALRSIGSWPFLSILTGTVLASVTQNRRRLELLSLAVAWLCGALLVFVHLSVYRTDARRAFDYEVVESAKRAAATGDWQQFDDFTRYYPPLAADYHRIRFGAAECPEH